MRLRSVVAGILLAIMTGGVTFPHANLSGDDLLRFAVQLRVGPFSAFERAQPTAARPGGSSSAILPMSANLPPEDIRADGERPQRLYRPPSRSQAILLLYEAARRHGVDPNLVLALSYWESGWDQSRVSATGAIGLMQVQPSVAAADGPRLLGRVVDLADPFDNADLGAAILAENLAAYQDPRTALAAYYQGGSSLSLFGPYPDTIRYVDGILALAGAIAAGQYPP